MTRRRLTLSDLALSGIANQSRTRGVRAGFDRLWDEILLLAEGMDRVAAVAAEFTYHVSDYAIPEAQYALIVEELQQARTPRESKRARELRVGWLMLSYGPATY